MFLLPASSRARVVFCALAFLIFLLVPGAPDSEFAGMPVTGPALLCFLGSVVVLICIAMFAPLRRIGAGWAIALVSLAVVKAVLAPWTFPEGWRAAYEVIDLRGTAPISFIDGPSARPFRIDRRIDFNGPFFNLPFFNDIFRYSEHFSPLRRDIESRFVFNGPVIRSWTNKSPFRSRSAALGTCRSTSIQNPSSMESVLKKVRSTSRREYFPKART